MVERSILRIPEPTNSHRRRRRSRFSPPLKSPGVQAQRQRFQATFISLSEALGQADPIPELRQDPSGIAPERALVFVAAGSIQRFVQAARTIGFEVFSEAELEGLDDYPNGFLPDASGTLPRTLYTTMPTLLSLRRLISFWTAYGNEEQPPRGAAPWWELFDLMLELRPWGPADRLNEDARAIINDRLPPDDNAEITVEIEIWPTANRDKRASWRRETEMRVASTGGRVLDRCSIAEDGFIYDAVLARLPVRYVRKMLQSSEYPESLVTIEGVKYFWPQITCQAEPGTSGGPLSQRSAPGPFNSQAPVRAALLDGVPAAGRAHLDGGVTIEDVHDLVSHSIVDHRFHATAMASLILRGDLETDGKALGDARIVSVPVLIDREGNAKSPEDRLFVDLIHTALTRLLTGDEPLGPNVFVVNFSIGVLDSRFAGRISTLAHLLDWWAAKERRLVCGLCGQHRRPLAAGCK